MLKLVWLLPLAWLAAGAGTARSDTLVYECAKGFEFVVQTGSAEAEIFLPSRQAVLPQVEAASGAKYQEGDLRFWSMGEEATLELGQRRVRDCRVNGSRAPWEDARLRGASFRASGNEPSWHLVIERGSNVRFVTKMGESELQVSVAEPTLDAGTRVYRTDADGHELLIRIRDEACRDSMSGAEFPSSARVALDGQEYAGCGRELGPVFAGSWQLDRFSNGDGPVATSEPGLVLDAWGLASGSGGCNRFSGRYEYASRPSLSFGPLAATMMACADPLGAQESRYLEALAQTKTYRLTGSELALLDEDGTVQLVFARSEPAP